MSAGSNCTASAACASGEAELARSTIHCGKNDVGCLVANHLFLCTKDVDVMPYSAFDTREAAQRIAETTLANARAFEEGRPRRNRRMERRIPWPSNRVSALR